jgi:hypothetical protein
MKAAVNHPSRSTSELGALIAEAFDAASIQTSDPAEVGQLAHRMLTKLLDGARWATPRNRSAALTGDVAASAGVATGLGRLPQVATDCGEAPPLRLRGVPEGRRLVVLPGHPATALARPRAARHS